MIVTYKQAIQYICFLFPRCLCLYYVTDLIKKLELRLLVTLIFSKD